MRREPRVTGRSAFCCQQGRRWVRAALLRPAVGRERAVTSRREQSVEESVSQNCRLEKFVWRRREHIGRNPNQKKRPFFKF